MGRIGKEREVRDELIRIGANWSFHTLDYQKIVNNDIKRYVFEIVMVCKERCHFVTTY